MLPAIAFMIASYAVARLLIEALKRIEHRETATLLIVLAALIGAGACIHFASDVRTIALGAESQMHPYQESVDPRR